MATEAATFQCSLDGAFFASCTSPTSQSDLAQGDHSFRVRAVDAAGNTDSSPATHNWRVGIPLEQGVAGVVKPAPKKKCAKKGKKKPKKCKRRRRGAQK
jgi:hypothetical protein